MQPTEKPEPVTDVRVRVVRTGGFAGLTRVWTAEPAPPEAPRWVELIEECPWDAAASASVPVGADRFSWRISARCADAPSRRAELSDAELDGPWRHLVDEVRAFDDGTHDPPTSRPGPVSD